MLNKLTPWQKTTLAIVVWIAIAILFSFAYTQSPLYEGNQNTKFLHGLAQAGVGYLKEDWLANTADPLPVFSALVALTARINPFLFYIEYMIMFGIYVFSLTGILTHVFKAQDSLIKKSLFVGLIFALHSRHLLWWIEKRYSVDLSFLHNGVAQQYLLGLEFQTNVFGVLLLLSIYLFLKRHYYWAIIALGGAAIIHPAYLFSAALLTISYIAILFVERVRAYERSRPITLTTLWHSARQPVLMGVLAIILVLPVVIYNQTVLDSTSPEIYSEAMRILVVERIPHHSLPSVWLGRTAYLQIGIILVGTLVVWKSRLGVIMLVLFSGAALFTGIQILTGNLMLAAIAPWRVSVILVPLGSLLIAACLINFLIDFLHLDHRLLQPVVVAGVLIGMVVLANKGYELQLTYGTSYRDQRVTQMMDYVRATKQPGELYMIPPRESDLNNFRLYTGAPTFINWKSHPYKDTDLLEWDRRVDLALAFYDAQFSDQEAACQILADIEQEYGVTHVVVKRRNAELNCANVMPTYVEEKFTVFAIEHP